MCEGVCFAPAQLCVTFFFHRYKKSVIFFFVFIYRIGIVLKLWMYLLFFKNICMWFGSVLILILISVFISKILCVCVCVCVCLFPGYFSSWKGKEAACGVTL
jgi:hypothetical protein